MNRDTPPVTKCDIVTGCDVRRRVTNPVTGDSSSNRVVVVATCALMTRRRVDAEHRGTGVTPVLVPLPVAGKCMSYGDAVCYMWLVGKTKFHAAFLSDGGMCEGEAREGSLVLSKPIKTLIAFSIMHYFTYCVLVYSMIIFRRPGGHSCHRRHHDVC